MRFKEDDSNIDSILLALVAGVGIGFGLGILYAPRAGSKTRAALARGANDRLDQLKDQFDDFSDSASDLLDKGKRAAAKHKDTLVSVSDSAKKVYRDVVG
jgi:gas vesicle protein